MLPDTVGAFTEPGVFGTRRRDAGEVALDVGGEHRHARGGELLGKHLERAGLSGAGGSGHQPVPVEHGDRDAHLHSRLGVTVDERPDFEHRPAEIVAGADHLDGIGVERADSRGPGGRGRRSQPTS